MLPQINKQTKQYIAINQIKFEEINNEEHNALFPLLFLVLPGLRNFVWRFFRSGLLEHILNLLLMIAH
ncbi:hypothetical protein AYO24_04800 [Coxiella burnetii]|nr:hypothetical protein AYO24_04800 [Coxiella burnetii]ATN83925.1 hypothetical protein AYO23_04815 [Coxiella burnetii]